MAIADDYEHSGDVAASRAREWAKKLDMIETLAGVGHWRLDLRTNVVSWSPEVYRIHGVTPEAFDPTLDDAIGAYHADDRSMLRAAITRAATTGEGYDLKLRIHRLSDQALRVVTAKAAVERGDDGAPAVLFGVFQDVTGQEETLARLAESEARYRLLADNATDIIVRASRDGVVRYASPSCRVLGVTPEEAVGRQVLDFVAPEDRAFAARVIDDLFAGREVDRSLRREYRVLRPDGALMWIEGNPRVLRDVDGAPTEYLSAFRDVTVRRAMEDELAAARDASEAAARTKSDFLANVSHELRTPLTSILGFAGLLRSLPSLDGDARRYADQIAAAGATLLATITDILDFTRVEAGQVEIRPRRVGLTHVLSQCLDLFEIEARDKGVTLACAGGDFLPAAVRVDPDRLRQVLVNLVGNALKFTDAGSVTLEARYDADRGRLRCAVIDTGCGVPVGRAAELFQRFSQVDASTTRRHGGAGLGLAICKGLVDAMGGTIGYDPTPGGGSRFWFEIPASLDEDVDRGPHVEVDAPGDLTHARVLIVDDHEGNRALVRAILSPFVDVLREAASGGEALRIANEEIFDIILLDLRMPDIDGAMVLNQIRNAGPNSAAPVLAFTADAGPRQRARLLAAGFEGCLFKPLSAAEVLGAVSGALATPRMSSAGGGAA